MFCTKCGKENANDSLFCVNCGNPLKENKQDEPKAPVEEIPVEKAPVEEAPVEEAPVEETPVEEAPVEEAPVEEAPVEEAPVEEAPVEEAPVEEAPVEEAPVEEAPVEKATVEKATVKEEPVKEVPVVEAPVSAPAKKAVKPESVGSKIFSGILSSFLSLFLVIALIVTAALCVVHFSLSEERIESSITSEALSSVIFTEDKEQSSLAKIICDEINENVELGHELTVDDLYNVLNDANVGKFASEKMASYLSSFLKGEDSAEITADEIVKLIKDNESVIEEKLGYTMSEDDYVSIEEQLEEAEIDSLSISSVSKKVGFDLSILSFFTSMVTFIVAAVIAFIFALLIFITNGLRKTHVSFSWVGAAALITSQIFLVVLTYAYTMSKMGASTPIALLISPALSTLFLVTGALTGLGILLKLIAYIIRKAKKA